MNIAYFSESYKPYLSGVTVALETFSQELEKRGNVVFIFAPGYPGTTDSNPRIFRFSSLPIPWAPKYRIAVPYFSKLWSVAAGLRLDIIHSHSPFTLGRISLKISKKLKIPFVFTFHTLFTEYLHYIPLIPTPLAKAGMIRYLRDFCNLCDCLVVPTQEVKSILTGYGVHRRIEIIPAGVNLQLVKSADGSDVKKRHGISADKKLLLFVGRLSKEKNLTFLFEAYQKIIASFKKVHFLVVAGGPLEKELKQKAQRLGIDKFMTFVGEVAFPQVYDYFAASDIFIFSSKTETQGLVLAEAKAAGLPTVAVRASGSSEMIRDKEDGFLVQEDAGLFGQKVLELLLDDKLRQNLSQKARLNAAAELSAEVCARKLELVYSSLRSQ